MAGPAWPWPRFSVIQWWRRCIEIPVFRAVNPSCTDCRCKCVRACSDMVHLLIGDESLCNCHERGEGDSPPSMCHTRSHRNNIKSVERKETYMNYLLVNLQNYAFGIGEAMDFEFWTFIASIWQFLNGRGQGHVTHFWILGLVSYLKWVKPGSSNLVIIMIAWAWQITAKTRSRYSF